MKWFKTGTGYQDASGRFKIERHKLGWCLVDTKDNDLFYWPTLNRAKQEAERRVAS